MMLFNQSQILKNTHGELAKEKLEELDAFLIYIAQSSLEQKWQKLKISNQLKDRTIYWKILIQTFA